MFRRLPHPCGRQILSLLRLPVLPRPLRVRPEWKRELLLFAYTLEGFPVLFLVHELAGLRVPLQQVDAQARAAIKVEPDEPIDDIIGLLESAGAKIFTRDFEIPKVFGFSAGRPDNGPAIAVNTSPDISIERQIFTVAHELGHLIMHGSSYGSDSDDGEDREETEANQFASLFLLPKEAFEQELRESAGLAIVDLVLHVKRKFRISYKTVLFRLVGEYGFDSSLYSRFAVKYGQQIGGNLRDHAEPDALQDPIARHEIEGLSRHDFVESGLVRLVKQAYEKELISASRAAEILQVPLEAMRTLESEWVAVDVGE